MRLFGQQWQARYWLLKYVEFTIVVVVFSAVYLMRRELPSDVLSGLTWISFFFLGAVEWLVYYGLFLSLKFNFFRWCQTIRVVGLPSRATRTTMRHFAELRHHKYGIQWVLFFIGAMALGLSFYLTHIGLFLAMLVVLVEQQLIERLRRIVPPAVLLLTTSTEDNLLLHARMCWTIRRLSAIALLKLDESHGSLVSIATRRDCFRTESDEVWQEVVHQFMHIAPIVVLDTRQITPAVLQELHRVVALGFAYKLVLVVGQAGERPLIDFAGDTSRLLALQGVPVAREAGLLTILHYLTRSRKRLPSPTRSIQTIIQDARQWQFVDRTQWGGV